MRGYISPILGEIGGGRSDPGLPLPLSSGTKASDVRARLRPRRFAALKKTAMAGAAVKRARAGGGSISDRLSALPDELLLRVLSFLPAQQVVRTTVLSKRWRDLWRSVPDINLSLSDFGRNSREDWTAVWERMEDFVNNLLMLHRAPCLDAFRLVTIVVDTSIDESVVPLRTTP